MSDKKIIELFFHEDVIKVYLEDNNKLCITFFEEYLNDKIYLELLEKLELFYEVCKKKNIQFYLILNFSFMTVMSCAVLIKYISKTSVFLNKHREFYKTYKFGTIFITQTNVTKKIAELVLSSYTPVRPYKFINDEEEVVLDFTFE